MGDTVYVFGSGAQLTPLKPLWFRALLRRHEGDASGILEGVGSSLQYVFIIRARFFRFRV